jgi:hypothetical protein
MGEGNDRPWHPHLKKLRHIRDTVDRALLQVQHNANTALGSFRSHMRETFHHRHLLAREQCSCLHIALEGYQSQLDRCDTLNVVELKEGEGTPSRKTPPRRAQELYSSPCLLRVSDRDKCASTRIELCVAATRNTLQSGTWNDNCAA